MNRSSAVILFIAIVLSFVGVYIAFEPKEILAQFLGILIVYAGVCIIIPLIIAFGFGKGNLHNKAYQISSYIFLTLVVLSSIGNQMMIREGLTESNSISQINLNTNTQLGDYCKKVVSSHFLDGLQKPVFSLTEEFLINRLSGEAFKYKVEGKQIIYEITPGKFRSVDLEDYEICQ